MRPDFPLRPILDHYGITYREVEGWQRGRCIAHDDHVASMSFRLDTGYVECFACDLRGGPIHLIQAKEGCDYEAALAIATKLAGEGVSNLRGRDAGVSVRRVRRGEAGYKPAGWRGLQAGSRTGRSGGL